MATIEISDLHPAGSDLFIDSESFLNDLNANELGDINGGGLPATTTVTTSTAFCISAAISASAVIGGFYFVTKS